MDEATFLVNFNSLAMAECTSFLSRYLLHHRQSVRVLDIRSCEDLLFVSRHDDSCLGRNRCLTGVLVATVLGSSRL